MQSNLFIIIASYTAEIMVRFTIKSPKEITEVGKSFYHYVLADL